MSADGTWSIMMQTPIGERKASLTLKDAGGALSGELAAEGNAAPIFDGKADGQRVAWKADIKNPMPLTLEFTGTVNGDAMSGTVSAGAVGSWPFSASRA